MNHKQSNTDSDLQKAIDDITKTTSVDPTFSDPVAAPSTLPEGDFGPIEPIGPFPAPEPPMAPVLDEAMPPMPPMPAPEMPAEFAMPAPATPEEAPVIAPVITDEDSNVDSNNIQHVKDSALRDLLPLLDKMNISPSQKFNICKDAFESLRDYTILDYAYKAAKRITDDGERGEALLYIVEVIDRIS